MQNIINEDYIIVLRCEGGKYNCERVEIQKMEVQEEQVRAAIGKTKDWGKICERVKGLMPAHYLRMIEPYLKPLAYEEECGSQLERYVRNIFDKRDSWCNADSLPSYVCDLVSRLNYEWAVMQEEAKPGFIAASNDFWEPVDIKVKVGKDCYVQLYSKVDEDPFNDEDEFLFYVGAQWKGREIIPFNALMEHYEVQPFYLGHYRDYDQIESNWEYAFKAFAELANALAEDTAKVVKVMEKDNALALVEWIERLAENPMEIACGLAEAKDGYEGETQCICGPKPEDWLLQRNFPEEASMIWVGKTISSALGMLKWFESWGEVYPELNSARERIKEAARKINQKMTDLDKRLDSEEKHPYVSSLQYRIISIMNLIAPYLKEEQASPQQKEV